MEIPALFKESLLTEPIIVFMADFAESVYVPTELLEFACVVSPAALANP